MEHLLRKTERSTCNLDDDLEWRGLSIEDWVHNIDDKNQLVRYLEKNGWSAELESEWNSHYIGDTGVDDWLRMQLWFSNQLEIEQGPKIKLNSDWFTLAPFYSIPLVIPEGTMVKCCKTKEAMTPNEARNETLARDIGGVYLYDSAKRAHVNQRDANLTIVDGSSVRVEGAFSPNAAVAPSDRKLGPKEV